MRNENTLDRITRSILGLVLYQLAFFWLGGIWSAIFYVLATVMFVTAIVGFCPLYKLLSITTYREDAKSLGKIGVTISILAFAVILVVGSYASDFFSKKIFLEDFNTMNNYYKQALFYTGQANREEAIKNYDQLVVEYADFQAKYSAYHPYAIKGDAQVDTDLINVSRAIAGVADQVRTGDLNQAHLALEEVRPVFQDIFKRNGFSMLAVTLVDFHDAMELILDPANEQDPQAVIAIYPEVSAKLNAVEAEANDAEIQTIRKNLDDLLSLAESNAVDELPAKSNELKSSFVKVYLKRG